MMPWSQWPTVAIRECYFARDLEVLVIESNFALLKIYPGKWWFTYPFSFFVFLKTGPEPECAPQCFFISKGISNIFNNNIEGRSNCKRHFSLDSGLQLLSLYAIVSNKSTHFNKLDINARVLISLTFAFMMSNIHVLYIAINLSN